MEYLKTGRGKCQEGSWFLSVDKCKIFPQIDTIILAVWPGIPKLPKITLLFLWKKVSYEIDFLHVDKHKSLLQIDTITLIEIVKHSQSSQNSEVTMSLQYLKKEVRKGVHF